MNQSLDRAKERPEMFLIAELQLDAVVIHQLIIIFRDDLVLGDHGDARKS